MGSTLKTIRKVLTFATGSRLLNQYYYYTKADEVTRKDSGQIHTFFTTEFLNLIVYFFFWSKNLIIKRRNYLENVLRTNEFL